RTLTLGVTSATNNAVLRSVNGSRLTVDGPVMQGTGGTILASGAASVVSLASTTITGGSVGSEGGGVVSVAGTSVLVDVTAHGVVEIPNSLTLIVRGEGLDSSALIRINPTGGGNATHLQFETDATLSGAGE